MLASRIKIEASLQFRTPTSNSSTLTLSNQVEGSREKERKRGFEKSSIPFNRFQAASKDGLDDAYKLAGDVALEFSLEEFRAVKRKIDWRVPGLCSAVYFLQFLDKAALNYASVTGLPIKRQQYNLLSMAFYIGFIAFVFPSQWLAQKFDQATYLGLNIIFWSICLALHAVSGRFASLFSLRLLTGIAESCVSPILIQIIAAHYPKNEQGLRISYFYVMNGLTGIVGGLMAYGITFYEGSFPHWKILYALLGCLSFLSGFVVIYFLPSSPVSAKFLSAREKRIALERVRGNASGTTQHQFKKAQAWESITDLKIWLILFITICSAIPNGGLSNFSAMIIKGFGYSSRDSLILGIPKGVIASVTTLYIGWLSDRKGERSLPILIALLPAVLGGALLVGFSSEPEAHKRLLLFGIYISATFGSSLSIVYAWNASNIAGSSKKTFANASTMFAFSAGNIAGTEIFSANDAPKFIPGKIAVLVLLGTGAIAVVALRLLVVVANRRKEERLEEMKKRNGWNEQEVKSHRDAVAFKDLTDGENPFFRYVH